ncbi:uncharacterized protein LOC123531272 [Mercenaria mercenaria]|uniref:uncharacterized protein LOC123531272 n=1 Tax=Mercenaria mercenaria TaxID=6596 RepID=UPI00234E5D7F|nr:uncharacterized protein LOC123531272 [Mercenaria mercenaria]
MKEVLTLIGDEHSTGAIAKLEEIEENLRRSTSDHSDELAGSTEKWSIVSDVKPLEKVPVPLVIESYNIAVDEYIEKADKALKCKGACDEHVSITILAEQKVDVCKKVGGKNIKNQCILKTVFGRNIPQKFIVSKAKTPDREKRKDAKPQWDEYEWLIYNILKFFQQKSDKKTGNQSFYSEKTNTFSNIFVVSKAFLSRLNLSLQTLGNYVRENAQLPNQHNLFIFDFQDPEIRQEFNSIDEILQIHTVMTLVGGEKEMIDIEQLGMPSVFLTLRSVDGLVISDTPGTIHSSGFSRTMQKSIHKCMSKLGKNNLSKLTFDHVCLEDPSTRVKLSFIPSLKRLVLKSCRFTPVLSSSILSIEIEEEEGTLASYLNRLNLIFPLAVQTCPRLEYIETSKIKIGSKQFSIKLDKETLETDMKNCCRKTLTECNTEIALTVLDHYISKILDNAKCSFRDYENANEVERKSILKGVCYGLSNSDPNLKVYPAVYYGEKRETVLVCYMRENFDVDNECVWGQKFRGFKTYRKSYDHVTTESSDRDYPVTNVDELKEYFENHSKNVEETIREHSTDLMKKHSNLEMIGICFKNNKEDKTDSSGKPCIALYVRLKSFVPYGESLFPSELSHLSKKGIVFKTDVREDYFVSLADSAAQNSDPMMKASHLAMGCSIGLKGNEIAASLGPFVEFKRNSETEFGFLTVCHLFSVPRNYRNAIGKEVVQPSESDLFVDLNQRSPRQETNTSSVCGKVVACCYDDNVDASLVRITDRAPYTGLFCYRKGDLRLAGFSREGRIPKYTDGSMIIDLNQCKGKTLVKFGKSTYLTSGKCLLQNSAVRTGDATVDVTCPTSGAVHSHKMFNQFQIKEISWTTFADRGDSGAGVFLVNDDKSLSCVGMVVGKTKQSGYCVATPITAILDSLSREYCCDVTLKEFT